MLNLRSSKESVRANIGECDRVLRPFLTARTAGDSDRAFQALWRRAESQIVQKLRRYLSASSEREDAEDAKSDALLQVSRALIRLRDRPDCPPIRSFDAVVGHVARNACWKTIQARHPERQVIKQDVSEAIGRLSDFAVWTAAGGLPVCGLTKWQRSSDDSASAAADRLQRIRSDPNAFLADHRIDISSARYDLEALVRAIVECVGQPVSISDLVSAVAALTRVEDECVSLDGASEADLPASRHGEPYEEVVYRRSLMLMWEAILELSHAQRSAMLLNFTLCDDGLYVFLETGIATMRDIARALEMPPDEFVKIWNDLPLSNKLIALHLAKVKGTAVSERKVIQYRDDAKDALARKLRRTGWWRDEEISAPTKPAGQSDKAGVGRL